MVKLVVVDKEFNDYTLRDDHNREYIVNIKFYIDEEIKVGNILYLPNSVLEEVNSYAYGPIREESKKEEDDLIKVITDKKELYLERYYG